MATPNRKRRPPGVTKVLGDVIDDTKALVDDALERAASLERGGGRAARHALGRDAPADASEDSAVDELDRLKAALDDLTAKVDRLARLRGAHEVPRP